jgi:hypothetical protein
MTDTTKPFGIRPLACRHCGCENREGVKYCGNCGGLLAPKKWYLKLQWILAVVGLFIPSLPALFGFTANAGWVLVPSSILIYGFDKFDIKSGVWIPLSTKDTVIASLLIAFTNSILYFLVGLVLENFVAFALKKQPTDPKAEG